MSVVYFFFDGEYTKIGITSGDVKVRMGALQSPRELVCLGQIPGGRDLEARLHRIFASRRVRGEWFEGEISAKQAEDAMQLDDERNRDREERARARKMEAKTLAARCKHLGEWLARHSDYPGFCLTGFEDWESPFVQIRYAPVLFLIDGCAESGISFGDVASVVRMEIAFAGVAA